MPLGAGGPCAQSYNKSCRRALARQRLLPPCHGGTFQCFECHHVWNINVKKCQPRLKSALEKWFHSESKLCDSRNIYIYNVNGLILLRTSHVARRTTPSHVTVSHVTRSHLTPPPPPTSRHTSHVTRRTSHAACRTSHC